MSSGGGAVGGGPVGGGNLQDVNASQSDQVIASSSAAARGSVGAGWGGGYFRFDCIFRHLGCDSKIYTGNTACQLCVAMGLVGMGGRPTPPPQEPSSDQPPPRQ